MFTVSDRALRFFNSAFNELFSFSPIPWTPRYEKRNAFVFTFYFPPVRECFKLPFLLTDDARCGASP